jgi:hypothetical protein
MAALDPPVAVEAPADAQTPEDVRDAEAEAEAVKYEIIEDVPDMPPETAEEAGEADDGAVGDAGGGALADEAAGEGGPAKKPFLQKAGEVVQKVGGVLKWLTVPIASSFEIAKRILPVPPFIKNLNFHAIGAKVRNTIDNVVTKIKTFLGILSPQQARQEMLNNETALLGGTVAQKQQHPIRAVVKTVFGKAGSFIRNTVQRVVTRVVPKVGAAIIGGARKIGSAIVSGIKTAAKAVGGFFQRIGQGIKSFLFG